MQRYASVAAIITEEMAMAVPIKKVGTFVGQMVVTTKINAETILPYYYKSAFWFVPL